MKKACCAAFLLAMLAQPVLAAEWSEKFVKDYDKFGLDVAVTNALADNVKPEDILAHVMKNREKISVKMSMKSLYCASVNRDLVQETASKLGVAPDEINKALQESIEECSSKMALQDRDVEKEKLADNGNRSGGSAPPAQPPAAQPAQQQQTGNASTLIETRRDEEKNPSPNR
ncbi:hypothetical protein [Candidatus Electronema sp. JM]|uniref:hypothetical protein n=1 Tax=Candidatus Electronema sp. JM TaxID=3401571 RepID=UPI003AA7EA7D